MIFQLTADYIFEAEDIDDAFVVLASHFLAFATGLEAFHMDDRIDGSLYISPFKENDKEDD